MRKALVVGIDFYTHVSPLFGCVNDGREVEACLEKHADGSPNFAVRSHFAGDASHAISRGGLKDAIEELFGTDEEIALFYFAGHGHVEATGGYLWASDGRRGDDGVALGEILTLADRSPARNRVIILDSCHSGVAGSLAESSVSPLKEGTTILTACTKNQYATEDDGRGVFTSLLVDALDGAAANLVGEVTPGSVYAHIDQSLGRWRQRPVFKTNVTNFVSLRTVRPPIDRADLRRLLELFPHAGAEHKLDPSYEPESAGRSEHAPPPVPANTERFRILQQYNRVNLVVPVGAPHMWHAAMESKSCKLTALGEHYRRLAAERLI